MTFGVNTSPLAGKDGRLLTSRQIRARLEREVLGNVCIEVHPTPSPDTFEVRGRGELQLAVLIEQMRREGFELQVSRPEVLLHEVDGAVHEPYERVSIDIPPEHIGTVTTSLAARRARLAQMTTDADGRTRIEAVMPTRGLVGYRGQFLTETRGTGLLHQIGEGYGPWAGEVEHRTSGVLVADRAGISNAYALFNLQERATLFIDAGMSVYEGMIVGLELPAGRHGRQPHEGEEAHQHPHAQPRRRPAPRSAAADDARDRHRVDRRRRARRGHAGRHPHAQATAFAARAAPRARPRGRPPTRG